MPLLYITPLNYNQKSEEKTVSNEVVRNLRDNKKRHVAKKKKKKVGRGIGKSLNWRIASLL